MSIEPHAIPRRVKVYLLHGETWVDNGTGYCSGKIENNVPFFMVRNELDQDEVLLKSPLEGSIQYQRQQETLIVWTPSEGTDIALSFEEPEGCASLCEFIISAQQTLSPNISLVASLSSGMEGEITELIVGPINYPEDPKEDNLDIILESVNQNSNSRFTRESISTFILEKKYISKLVDFFNKCEAKYNLKCLYSICDILKSLVLYNETQIIEEMAEDDNLLGVIGILEYDPDFPCLKANHRDHLSDETKFKEVIPIPDEDIKKSFKKHYILQYFKDVVLVRLLDDPNLNFISTLIYFNQVSMITFFKSPDNQFLKNFFNLYNIVETKDPKRQENQRDGVKMIYQFVLIAKSLQPPQRTEFFTILVRKGLFKMFNFALKDSNTNMRVLCTEIIVLVIEQDVSLVNMAFQEAEYKQMEKIGNTNMSDTTNEDDGTDDDSLDNSLDGIKSQKGKVSTDMTLISLIADLFITDENPGLKIQAFEALKVLLEPQASINPNSVSFSNLNTIKYFRAFYSKVAPKIFGLIVQLANESEIKTNFKKHEILLFQQLCDLVSFCTSEHEIHISRPFFLQNHVLSGVSKLIGSRFCMQLRLAGLRCIKNIILLNDDLYTKYIISNNVLDEIFRLFKDVKHENNLANSSCLDLLELVIRGCERDDIKKINFRVLANQIHNSFRNVLEDIDYVTTGTELLSLVENGFCNSTSTPLSAFNGDSTGGYPDYVEYIGENNSSGDIGLRDLDDDEDITPEDLERLHGELENGDSDEEDEVDDEGETGADKDGAEPKDAEEEESDEANSTVDSSFDEESKSPSDVYDTSSPSPNSNYSKEKRQRELDLEEAHPNGTNKKKISSTLKNRFSNASKKIALSLRGDKK